MPPLIILRPQPGANHSAERAAKLGLDTIVAPLFTVSPIAWAGPPAQSVDGLLLTSAHAVREGGTGLDAYRHLPCFCVGEATAAAARASGFTITWVGDTDGKAVLEQVSERGLKRLLWLSAKQHTPLSHPTIMLDIVPVYEARRVSTPVILKQALHHPAIILVHSQRAARALAEIVTVRDHHCLIAISKGVAAVAGKDWASVQWPELPRDQDMLELAATMCQKARP